MSTVRRVEINTDVYWVCEDHAFSTEREEIMGLLMGDVGILLLLCYVFSMAQ
jgi:JAB1/Mov34/MPN/PAD-1 ubiquitin protease